MKNLIIFIALVISIMQVQAQPVPQDSTDLVWSKITDQGDGFYMVKFSDTDSLIVGHGYNDDLLFDVISGQEIHRIHNDNEVFFINNDINFVVLDTSKNKFVIYDTKSFTIIDSLENDKTKIYPYSAISKDKNYLVSLILGGLRIWNITTKTIIKTKWFLNEQNLTKFNIENIKFLCDNKIIATHYKEYFNPSNPNNPITRLYHTIFDFNTLDSIDAFQGMAYFQISNNCLKIAFKRTDPTYGVEVYDLNTKDLLWKVPINGPSLTGIEFSPDDKYLVTAPTIKVWDIDSQKEIYSYQSGSSRNIDVSHDGKYIINSIGNYLFLWNTRFGPTIVAGDNEITTQLIYPNPATGKVTIKFEQPKSENTIINLSDLSGRIIKLIYNNIIEKGEQNIDFNTNELSNNSYLINIQNSHLSLVFKLIVNK